MLTVTKPNIIFANLKIEIAEENAKIYLTFHSCIPTNDDWKYAYRTIKSLGFRVLGNPFKAKGKHSLLLQEDV